MGRKYKNPPLLETVCEFRFDPNSPWDLAIPGLLYEKLRTDFPNRKPTKKYESAVSAGPEPVQQQIQIKATDGLRFSRKDGLAHVQVSPQVLTVNHLKPYPTWEGFLPIIEQALRAYLEVADPPGFKRIGLRYINRIDLHGTAVNLGDYFDLYPFVGNALGDYGPFFLGLKIPCEGGRDILNIQMLGLAPDRPDVITILLDLDYSLVQSGQVKLGEQVAWLNQAHTQIEENFGGCLKDTLREQFEEVMT